MAVSPPELKRSKLDMKHFFRLILIAELSVFAVSETRAQTQNLAGFVFANAVGVSAKADVTASGKKLTKNGIEAGMATSGLGLPVGNYQLQVTAPGCESATAPLTIAPGATPVVVAYLERKIDPRTRAIKNFIRLLQLPSEPQENKYLIKVISVDADANLTANASGQAQTLQNLKPAVFEAKNIRITDSAGGTEEAKVSDKGSYYCFAFRKADGKPGTSLVLQRIYQW
jgi:hypothetical protein